MSTWELGFADGERAAWDDRRNGRRRELPNDDSGYSRGFRAAYQPRSAAWSMRNPRARVLQTIEGEQEAAR